MLSRFKALAIGALGGVTFVFALALVWSNRPDGEGNAGMPRALDAVGTRPTDGAAKLDRDDIRRVSSEKGEPTDRVRAFDGAGRKPIGTGIRRSDSTRDEFPAAASNGGVDGVTQDADGVGPPTLTSGRSAGHGPDTMPQNREQLVAFLKEQGAARRGLNAGADDASLLPEIDDGSPEDPDDRLLLSVPLNGSGEADSPIHPIAEENLTVAKSGDGMAFADDSVLAFPDASMIRPDEGTISIEIEPAWNGSDPGNNSFVQIPLPGSVQGRMWLFRNGQDLRFGWFDESGAEQGLGVNIENWKAGDPHAVTTTWGDDVLSIYVDGQLAGRSVYDTQNREVVVPPDASLLLGSAWPGFVPGANATLRNFKVYDRSLDAVEVAQAARAGAQAE